MSIKRERAFDLSPKTVLGALLALTVVFSALPALAQTSPQSRSASPQSKSASPQSPENPFYHYKQAQYFEREGKSDKAEAALRQSMALAPTDYLNYVKLASLLAQRGQTQEAISLYKKAMTLDAQDPMLHFSLGALYEQAENPQYELAEREYQNGLLKNPLYHFGQYNLARVQMQQGKYDLAQQNFSKFLVTYPDHFEARKYLANVYLVNRQAPLAAQEYETLKAKFPNRFNDSLNLARALTQSDAPQQALEELKAIYAQEGNKADILEEMGNAHQALGQLTYANQNYQKSYELDAKRYPLLLKIADNAQKATQPEQTAQALNTYLSKEPGNESVRHWLANTYVTQKQYDQALKELQDISLKSENPQMRYQADKETAYVYQLKGDLARAILRYEALLSNPQAQADTQMKTNLALAYHKEGRLSEAVSTYQLVYNALPAITDQTSEADQKAKRILGNDLANALVALGDEAYKNQQYDAALLRYTEATQYALPDNSSPYLGLGNAYFAMNLPDQAQDAYEKVLIKNPEDHMVKLALAKVKLQQQKPQESIEILSRLTAANPNNVEIHLALGDAYNAAAKPKEAVLAYEKAQALQDAQGKFLPAEQENLDITIGALWQALGDYQKAKLAYEKALALRPENPKTHYNLGIVYNELGQLDLSVQSYQKAIQLDPSFADSRYGLALSYEKQQKYQDALDSYKTYQQLPNASYVKEAEARINLIQQALNPVATPKEVPSKLAPVTPVAPVKLPTPNLS